MVLWIIFAILTAGALVAVLWPYLRPPQTSDDAGAYDTAVFKDQIGEIEAERERGIISEAEAESARAEVSRRLLSAAKTDASQVKVSKNDEPSAVPTAALVAAFLLVPLTSSALYLLYGSPGLPDRPLAARLAAAVDGQKIDALVARVEARLREHPQDGRGWEVIAPVYLRQRRFGDAADAYGKALRILGETPQRLADFGNALVLAHDGVVTEQARQVLQKAFKDDPSQLRAPFWLAIAHEQDGETAKARTAWRDLLERGGPDAPWRAAVEERLAALQSPQAEARPGGVNNPETEQQQPNEPGGPSQEEIAAARDMSASDRNEMIRQMVAGLAERLKTQGGTVDEWQRLVRSYTVLGDRDAAGKALADGRAALADKPEALASLNAFAEGLGL